MTGSSTGELPRVLGREPRVLLERGDRLVGPALSFERVRKRLVRFRLARMLVHPLLRGGDRGPASTAFRPERVADHLAEVEASGAHAEEREARAEDDHHHGERPLRLRAQAREEEGALYRARGATAAAALGGAAPVGGASIARLARSAAAVNSCHSNPPFS